MVLVDCSVFDGEGRFLLGLTADDFAVREDGQPMEITYFALQRFGELAGTEAGPSAVEATRPTGMAGAEAPVPVVLPRYVVLFVDAFNTADNEWSRIREDVVEYVRDELKPSDKVLVATLGHDRRLRISPEFVSDPELVEKTLRALRGSPDVRERNLQNVNRLYEAIGIEAVSSGGDDVGGEVTADRLRQAASLASFFANERRERVLYTLQMLVGTATYLDRTFAVPGPKMVLMISGGMALQPGAGYYHVLSESARQAALATRGQAGIGGWDPLAYGLGDRKGVEDALRAAVGALNRLNYTVYAIDARGSGAFFGDRASRQFRTGLSPETRAEIFKNEQAGLVAVAAGTGGLAFTDTGNFAGALREFQRDTAFRYVLGYAPPAHAAEDVEEGRYYRIDVDVGIPGARVRARDGYVDRHDGGATRTSGRY